MSTTEKVRVEYMPLSALRAAPRNPKLHKLDSLDESFERFGQVEPVTLDERTGQLVAGHGRVEGLSKRKAAGRPPPRRVEVAPDGEWLIPVIRGVSFADEREAEAYILASNRIPEIGGWDPNMLTEMINDLGTLPALAGTGFGALDIEKAYEDAQTLAGAVPAGAAAEAPPEFKAHDENIETAYCCPKCSYSWSGKPK